jgi:hypothetical protein
MVSRKNRVQRRSRRQQRGGNVGYPLQWFNPSATVPGYYAPGSEMLTKQYSSAYGPINAVSMGTVNACGTEMGPNLAPFNPYQNVSGIMTGGSLYKQIVNPLNGQRVNIRSKKGQQILRQYLKRV